MKRKFLSLLLVGCLTCGIFSNITITVSYGSEVTQSDIESKEIKRGDKVQGFVVTKVTYDETTQSQQICFKHIKTGAEMLVIKNSDLNRGFAIDFNTPCENDKGISHILEHSLLGGSEKYPINNMIFNVMNNTYSSFVNALTYQNMTVFPVSSQSEEQLMKLTDVYLDAVYNPLIAKDKKVFEREAWRYEMEDENSPLTINGIVYNEMKGNYGNIDLVSKYNAKNILFKDTNQRYVSGGKPDSIINLTYDEFLNTYKKNYTPSNSFMVLYGDVNYENFLKMINDNYLSSSENKKLTIKRTQSKENKEIPKEIFDFPAASDYDCKNKSVIDFALALPDIKKVGAEDYTGVSILVALFNLNSSSLQNKLQNSNIAESYSCIMDGTLYQPAIHFIAKNADENKINEFYDIIMNELKKLSSDGINKDSVKSLISTVKFSEAFAREIPAYSTLLSVCQVDNILGDGTIDLNAYIKNIEKKLDYEYLEHLISKYFINNKRAVLTATVPKAGLLEENTKNFEKRLQEKKDSMSSEEKSEIIKNTKEFKEWNDKEPDKNVIQSLKAISSKDLPIEVKDYNITKSEENEVNLYTADADIKDGGFAGLVFDESHLSNEELLYLKFYASLLNSIIPSDKYSEASLSNELICKSSGLSYSLTSLAKDKDDSAAYPAFILNYNVLKDDIKDMLNLNGEVLLHSKIKDNSYYINRAINSEKTEVLQNITQGTNSLFYRALAKDNLKYRYLNYFYGVDYYNFIADLEKQFNENPEAVYNKLETTINKAFNKNNLTVLFAGNKESQDELKNNMSNLTLNLNSNSYEKVEHDLPIPAKREAITANTEVSYTLITSNLKKTDIKDNGKFKVLAKILDDKVLIPELRLKGGSYTVSSQCSNNNFTVYAYRDSNFLNTLKVVDNGSSYVRDITSKMDDNSLENYVISTFGDENSPTGEVSDASYRLIRNLQGYTLEDEKQLLQEIKDTTTDSLKDADVVLDKLKENQNYIIITSPEKVEANKDLFDNIISLN